MITPEERHERHTFPDQEMDDCTQCQENIATCQRKQHWVSPGMANVAAYQIGQANNKRLYTYQCDYCTNWHLTRTKR